MGRQGVERRLHLRVIRPAGGGARFQAAKEGGAEGVGGKEAVQVAARRLAVGGDGPLAATAPQTVVQLEEGPRQPRPFGDTDMHLKAAHSGAAFKVRALHLLQRLSARQHGLDVEPAEPVGGSTRGPLDALGIADASAEHLIAAAESRSDEHTSELQSLMRISYAV